MSWRPPIKYVTLFLANCDPTYPVTLCHTSRKPLQSTSRVSDPRVLVDLEQKSRTKAPLHVATSLEPSSAVTFRNLRYFRD